MMNFFIVVCFVVQSIVSPQNIVSPQSIVSQQSIVKHASPHHAQRFTIVPFTEDRKEMEHTITISVKQNNIDLLKSVLDDMGDPRHASYQKWLTAAEVGALVRNEAATEAVHSWIDENHLTLIESF